MRIFAVILGLLLCSIRAAAAEAIEVDLELVLLADVSRSMSPAELEIQRQGYAQALASEEVFGAIRSGMLGRIALTYVEWAGSQHVVVNWRLIDTRDSLQDFADELIITYNPGLRRTSISNALDLGAQMIAQNQYEGLRKVIDISGDGPNNDGGPVTASRDRVLEKGITINGLPLLTHDGPGDQWFLPGLDLYFRTCVIGGPGAFVLPVHEWEDFAESVRRKLVLEIAGHSLPPERVFRAQGLTLDPTDCGIGEKIWAQRRRQMGDFGTP